MILLSDCLDFNTIYFASVSYSCFTSVITIWRIHKGEKNINEKYMTQNIG
jgi:hypothetical protein